MREREGENLEHRTQLVDVLRHDVAARSRRPERAQLGSKSGSDTIARISPVLHVHHDAAGGAGAEFSRASSTSCASMYCTRMSREMATPVRVGAACSSAVRVPSSRPATPLPSGSVDAEHLHGGEALRIIALLGRFEFEPRQAQMHHLVLRSGVSLARDQHIGMLAVRRRRCRRASLGAGGLGEIVRGFVAVPNARGRA